MKLILISLVSYLFLSSNAYSLPLCPIAPSPEFSDPCEPSPAPIDWGDDTGPGVKLSAFKTMAYKDQDRCEDQNDRNYALGELKYGLDNDIITEASYNWGVAYEYYPVIDRNGNVKVVCTFGCFEANTMILGSKDGLSSEIKVSELTINDKVWTLSSYSTMSSLNMIESGLLKTTKGPESTDLYVFHFNDKAIKLTQHHGVLLSNGKMVAAKDITLHDKLVDSETGDDTNPKRRTIEKLSLLCNNDIKGDCIETIKI